jgi:cell division protein FtsL
MRRKSNAKFVLDIFASKVSLLILGALTAWLGYSAAKESYRKHQVQKEIDTLRAEILELERKNIDLSSILNSFGDPQSVELEAKRRLNLKSPGEEVAVILRGKNDESQNIVRDYGDENYVGKDESEKNSPQNPSKWWKYIMGNR